MTNGQELGEGFVVETGSVNEDGTVEPTKVDTYPCKIVFTTTYEKTFKNQKELIAWTTEALPSSTYTTCEADDAEEQQRLNSDYEGHGFEPPSVPINTPSKVLALISYDIKYESMGPGDYSGTEQGEEKVEIIYE